MSQFRDAYGEFRRQGVEVAALSVDSPYSHRAWAAELNIPYPLLSDFAREFLTSYRVPLRAAKWVEPVGWTALTFRDAEEDKPWQAFYVSVGELKAGRPVGDIPLQKYVPLRRGNAKRPRLLRRISSDERGASSR